MKPGILTTEFWLALAAHVGGFVAAFYSQTDIGQVAGFVLAVVAALGYTLSRTLVKAAPGRAKADLLQSLAQTFYEVGTAALPHVLAGVRNGLGGPSDAAGAPIPLSPEQEQALAANLRAAPPTSLEDLHARVAEVLAQLRPQPPEQE